MPRIQMYGVVNQRMQDDVREQLNGIAQDQPLEVAIASPGGLASVGVTVYNWLKQYESVNVYIEGDVMSAGTVIAAAGDYVEMPDNAMLMVHRPYLAEVGGDADELRKAAKYLDQVEANVIKIYHARTRLASGMISRMMGSETYLDAKDAAARGFVDNVTSPQANMAHKESEYLVQDQAKLAEMLASRPVYVDQSAKRNKLKDLINA